MDTGGKGRARGDACSRNRRKYAKKGVSIIRTRSVHARGGSRGVAWKGVKVGRKRKWVRKQGPRGEGEARRDSGEVVATRVNGRGGEKDEGVE